ncbi:zinc ribbon domain-containing protein [Clostridium sardiniense]|uniref:Zinc ribbon domain-containing protein n=1 Tax=Clostridium sardiniense TaxID=29369 RepID=A0ABS7L121_CLOSR|nr:zinc ribbon domain-containing protein [Clostridium sardiniense]MBY0756764.1 zinc ribbon domain-containing protein [Clostridium sardiniense]MDQ0460450.1 DNA-directed RNA polymerase subunit RPC12/RpoP [Clostridium sardiniense]
MFFIGIFGIESGQKEIKTLNNISCKVCNFNTTGQLIKTFSLFQFFFIPIFKWNEMYYIKCNRCSTIYEIPKDKGKKIENGEDVDITYWDLNEIDNGHSDNHYYSPKNICPSCGRTLEGDFKYCPYCGTKIK